MISSITHQGKSLRIVDPNVGSPIASGQTRCRVAAASSVRLIEPIKQMVRADHPFWQMRVERADTPSVGGHRAPWNPPATPALPDGSSLSRKAPVCAASLSFNRSRGRASSCGFALPATTVCAGLPLLPTLRRPLPIRSNNR
jgi:hypothetical protein